MYTSVDDAKQQLDLRHRVGSQEGSLEVTRTRDPYVLRVRVPECENCHGPIGVWRAVNAETRGRKPRWCSNECADEGQSTQRRENNEARKKAAAAPARRKATRKSPGSKSRR